MVKIYDQCEKLQKIINMEQGGTVKCCTFTFVDAMVVTLYGFYEIEMKLNAFDVIMWNIGCKINDKRTFSVCVVEQNDLLDDMNKKYQDEDTYRSHKPNGSDNDRVDNVKEGDSSSNNQDSGGGGGGGDDGAGGGGNNGSGTSGGSNQTNSNNERDNNDGDNGDKKSEKIHENLTGDGDDVADDDDEEEEDDDKEDKVDNEGAIKDEDTDNAIKIVIPRGCDSIDDEELIDETIGPSPVSQVTEEEDKLSPDITILQTFNIIDDEIVHFSVDNDLDLDYPDDNLLDDYNLDKERITTPPTELNLCMNITSSTGTSGQSNYKTKKFYESDNINLSEIFSQTIQSAGVTPTDEDCNFLNDFSIVDSGADDIVVGGYDNGGDPDPDLGDDNSESVDGNLVINLNELDDDQNQDFIPNDDDDDVDVDEENLHYFMEDNPDNNLHTDRNVENLNKILIKKLNLLELQQQPSIIIDCYDDTLERCEPYYQEPITPITVTPPSVLSQSPITSATTTTAAYFDLTINDDLNIDNDNYVYGDGDEYNDDDGGGSGRESGKEICNKIKQINENNYNINETLIDVDIGKHLPNHTNNPQYDVFIIEKISPGDNIIDVTPFVSTTTTSPLRTANMKNYSIDDYIINDDDDNDNLNEKRIRIDDDNCDGSTDEYCSYNEDDSSDGVDHKHCVSVHSAVEKLENEMTGNSIGAAVGTGTAGTVISSTVITTTKTIQQSSTSSSSSTTSLSAIGTMKKLTTSGGATAAAASAASTVDKKLINEMVVTSPKTTKTTKVSGGGGGGSAVITTNNTINNDITNGVISNGIGGNKIITKKSSTTAAPPSTTTLPSKIIDDNPVTVIDESKKLLEELAAEKALKKLKKLEKLEKLNRKKIGQDINDGIGTGILPAPLSAVTTTTGTGTSTGKKTKKKMKKSSEHEKENISMNYYQYEDEKEPKLESEQKEHKNHQNPHMNTILEMCRSYEDLIAYKRCDDPDIKYNLMNRTKSISDLRRKVPTDYEENFRKIYRNSLMSGEGFTSENKILSLRLPVVTINTGISVKDLCRSYEDLILCSDNPNTIPDNQRNRYSNNRNIFTKTSFSKFDALQKNVLHVRSSDPDKAQEKFNGPAEIEKNCHSCGKVVFQMEQIKAEKNLWHKNCFRCSECNKQLNVDTYQSHESILYCKPHFKALFTPKAVEDNEPVQVKKHELIIRESQPIELSPDVARSSDKPDLGLDELHQLNVKERFQVFEHGDQQPTEQLLDRSPGGVKRSQSILSKLARFQAKGMDIGVTDDSLNGVEIEQTTSEEEDEEGLNNEDVDIDLIRAKRAQKERPIRGENMDDIKTRFESGHIMTKEERREERKQEIQNIRSRLFLGKQAKIKEMYQQAVADSEVGITASSKKPDVDIGDKAKSIKERFERGEAFNTIDEDEANNQAQNKANDGDVFEQAISKKSRSLFMELDASASKSQGVPQNNVNTPTTPRTPDVRKHLQPFASEEVVKCDDKVEDVKIETAEISSKFKFFERYQPNEKEKKKFRITPPREGVVKMSSPERDVYRDPDVVRGDDMTDDPAVAEEMQTASKMLSIFRQMEQKKYDEYDGPKPLKRFTPPPDDGHRRYDSNSENNSEFGDSDEDDDEDDDEEEEEEEGSDPDNHNNRDYVRSSDKYEDEFLKQAQTAARAKQLRAKFEKWESKEIKREQNNSSINLYDSNEDSQVESAKSLRAKFESMRNTQSQQDNHERVKVNRFV